MADPMIGSHVVAMPYPGRGHINAMLNLCKILTVFSANAKKHLLITFVITEEWLCLIGSDEKPPNIQFTTLENVLPSEKDRAADLLGFIEAIQTKMLEPFERILDRLDKRADLIIADTLVGWAIEVANRRNIPVASMWPMPAAVFSVLYHFDLLIQNGQFPYDISEAGKGGEEVDYIPGITSIRLKDLPTAAALKDHRILNILRQAVNKVPQAQYLLLTTIFELEPQVIDSLKQNIHNPLFTFGPVIPYFKLGNSKYLHDQTHYFQWLNSQTPSSVLYVSLGSYLSVSNAQMGEIIDGLRESGVSFLFIGRGESTVLQERCGDLGIAVPWCEQLEVLCHSSIGGFWTHCGWNSTIEGIFSCVPFITLPIMADQPTVRKYIVDDWKIGWDAKGETKSEKLLKSRDISKLVKDFMDLESVKRKEMMKRVREFQAITRGAMSDEGSSMRNIYSFIENFMRP